MSAQVPEKGGQTSAALQALDRAALIEVARADQVKRGFARRPMTVEDAARLVSRDYAAAADWAAALRKATAEVAKAIDDNERVQRAGQNQGDQRWQQMGSCARSCTRLAHARTSCCPTTRTVKAMWSARCRSLMAAGLN